MCANSLIRLHYSYALRLVKVSFVRPIPQDHIDIVERECGSEPLDGARVTCQAVDALQ